MIGGLLKSTSSLAIVAAAGMFIGGLALTPAMAADLGGDCCADLEERVADLEATTARKGNRKVSLTVSGWVARDFGWIDDADGFSEFYASGHGPSGSRVQFAGSAKMSSNWTAGYVLRFRITEDRNSTTLTNAGSSQGGGFVHPTKLDKNYIYFKNAGFGTFVLGHTYAPTDGVAEISLGGRGVTGASSASLWNATDLNGFNLENGDHEAVAYISPTIAGFTLAVAWADLDDHVTALGGGVDVWDMALRYANEFGPIRIAAGIGYTTTDDDTNAAGAAVDGANVMGSIALLHVPTGLNVAFAAGTEVDGGLGTLVADVYDKQFWHVQGGVNSNFFGPGNTSIYAEYGEYDFDGGNTAGTAAAVGVASVDTTMWGLGVVQHFDSAATELYIAYRHWEDDGTANGDVDQIMGGARIKF
ncbi:MAG: porin [bacterium]|nr:porin [bacterium]